MKAPLFTAARTLTPCRRLGLLLIAAVCACGADGFAADLAGRPNIVLIVADDLGYGELGCYGGRDVPTPHLDALAQAGVRFTDAYVTAPFCAASRAGLLTGRYQTRFGFEFNPIGPANADPAIGLPLEERTIADYLRDAGYATALVGKWHQGGSAKFHPQRRGFDEFFGFLHEGHYYAPVPWAGHTTWLRRKTLPDGSQGRWTSPDSRVVWSTHMSHFEPDYDADNPLLRASQPVDEAANLTNALTREAESFIARHKTQPFFVYLSYSAVHSPLQAADAWMNQFGHIPDIQRRIFAAMLAQLDDGVGRVVARLRTEGVAQRTLVIFLSDNGGPTRELTSSNRPLRGEKGQLLEGGIRVPLIVRWDGRLPAGRTEQRFVSALDLLPTMLAAAGVESPVSIDGVDLLPYLVGDDGGGEPIRTRHYWRVGRQAALRDGEWKIFRALGGQSWQLYNLLHDPAEQHDLSAIEIARVATLEAAWKELDAKMIPPLWERRARQSN